MNKTTDEILTDEKCAMMTAETLGRLPVYNLSLPTGADLGKRWLRFGVMSGRPLDPECWWMGEYVEHHDPRYVGITWREVVLV